MKAIALSSPGVVGARPSKASEERICVAVVRVASETGGADDDKAEVRFASAATQPARNAAPRAGTRKERSGKSGLPVSRPPRLALMAAWISRSKLARRASACHRLSPWRGQVIGGEAKREILDRCGRACAVGF